MKELRKRIESVKKEGLIRESELDKTVILQGNKGQRISISSEEYHSPTARRKRALERKGGNIEIVKNNNQSGFNPQPKLQ
jgi:hypothetical protein